MRSSVHIKQKEMRKTIKDGGKINNEDVIKDGCDINNYPALPRTIFLKYITDEDLMKNNNLAVKMVIK